LGISEYLVAGLVPWKLLSILSRTYHRHYRLIIDIFQYSYG